MTTGDTLCDTSKPIILERMEFPDPVIEIAVEPKTKADHDKMSTALQRLAAEDPSFRIASDPESGQTVIKGMGELHLDIIVDRMKREFSVEANIGAPQVAYRETISKQVDIDYTHKKQTGGAGQFARVQITFEPTEPGTGFEFESKVVGGSVPREYIPGVQKGIGDSRESGILAGFPVIDFKATLFDGASRRRLIGDGLRNGGARRFPRSDARRRVPVAGADDEGRSRDAGGIYGRHYRRPEQPSGQRQQHGSARQTRVVNALVPLANMFGYINTLRSSSQGRAQFTMQFDHYAQVPQAVAEEVRANLA